MACRVERWITETVSSLGEDASVQAAAELMARNNQGSLVVTRGGEVAGLFTERDLLRRVVGAGRDPREVTLAEACTRDLVSVPHDSNCLAAIAKMQAHRCRRLLVYRGARFLGLVTLTDLAHALAERRGGKDLVVNALGAITLVVAIAVIGMLLLQLPEMMRLAGRVNGH